MVIQKGNRHLANSSPTDLSIANKAKKRNHEVIKVYYNSSCDVIAPGSPPQFPLKQQSAQRQSPSRSSPPAKMMMAAGQSSSPGPGGLAYAGAKFSEPPSPGALPRPPPSWFGLDRSGAGGPAGLKSATVVPTPCFLESRRCNDISDHLKVLLKVRA